MKQNVATMTTNTLNETNVIGDFKAKRRMSSRSSEINTETSDINNNNNNNNINNISLTTNSPTSSNSTRANLQYGDILFRCTSFI